MLKYLISCLPSIFLCLAPTLVHSQTYTPSNRNPVPDSTLGTQVSGTGNNFNITGGLNKGQTLFHSFSDFSVPTAGAANFVNSPATRDIITRVTGNNFSDINGLINSNGANFFLINPNGVTFGTDARLNVGRAFMASTANGITLVDAGGRAITFGTNANGDAPLLSIAPNVLFNVSSLNIGSGAGQINNFGRLQNATPNQNQYIGLIGGNVNFNGGQIIAPGANVELGGLSQAGTVGFSLDRGVQFPENVTRGNVSLVTVGAVPSIIDVFAGGGNVNIFATDIALIGKGNTIVTGIASGLGSPTAQAGDIKLDATGKVTISESNIFNQVAAGGTGKGGNIEIKTGNLAVTNGAQLAASTFGQGDAGNVKITATGDILFDGKSVAFSNVLSGAVGKGGNIEIKTGNLAVTNGAQLSASTFGQGDAGSVKITAAGDILFDGIKDGFSSAAFSTVKQGAVGKGGGVEITTGNLAVTNAAQLSASTFGTGDAGSVKITATGNILFDGRKDGFGSTVSSTVEPGAVGKGGGVEITTGNLTVTNAAQLQASTKGQGDAGNVKISAAGDILFDGRKDGFYSGAGSTVEKGAIGKGGGLEIKTGNLTVTNGAQLSASTDGQGDAGSMKITAAGDILFDGSKDGFSSVALSTVGQGAVGKGGGLEIITGNLAVTNGAQLSTSTDGQGDAGSVKITAAGDILFDGGKDAFRSGAFSTIEQGAVGKGGGIEITAGNLAVTNGAQLQANTKGQGDAGNVKITATGDILFDGRKDGFGSTAFSTIEQGAVGKGGGIEITTGNLSVTNGAALTSSSFGQGDAGNIALNANTIALNQGEILSQSIGSTGGDLKIVTKDYLLLRNDSFIATDSFSTGKDGNGGNITINSPLLIATPGNNDISANANFGNGGRVNITSQGLFGIGFRPKGQESDFTNDITASSEFGQNGTVNISTPGTDPGKDSNQLPNVPTDASNQISQACGASTRANKLTVTGRGGIPDNADDPLNSDVVWQDARATSPQPAARATSIDPFELAPPAVGWKFDGKGKVTLLAATTQARQTGTSVICPNGVRK